LLCSPKWDKRFDENTSGGGQFVTDDELEDWREEEAKEDREAARQLDEHHQALQSLDPALVERASEVLVRHINEDRIERVESVLKQRTKQSRFLFENPTNPSNVWACLRTIDSFGIQNVDVVMQGDNYRGKAAIVQKKGMRTAMGSAQWLTLINHPDTASAVASIKQQGFKIYASDLNPNSKDVRELDWVNAGPICVVMGNENNGISDEMRELADETFTLPMSGFAESFNLSVATAITLAHMSAKSGTSPDDKTKFGPLQPGNIDDHEYACLRLKGLLNSLPQKRMGRAILRNEGIDLPNAIDLL
jgi:tRNA (guanosine-2'-O-)-methyltransferase